MKSHQLPCPGCGRALRRPWVLFPGSSVRCTTCGQAFAIRLARSFFPLPAAFFILSFVLLKLAERHLLPDRRFLPSEVSFSVAVLVVLGVAVLLAVTGTVTVGPPVTNSVQNASTTILVRITGVGLVVLAVLVVALWLIAYGQSSKVALVGSVLGVAEIGLFGVYVLLNIASRRAKNPGSTNAA